jgi:PAS domain S-box-containing protein
MPFRTIFEVSPAAMAVEGLDGRLVDVNPTFARLLGYRRTALRGKRVLEITHPADVDASRQAITRAARGERGVTLEKRYLRRDGTEVFALTSLAAVRTGRGEPRYLLATIQDLSDKVRAEAAARRTEAELKQFAEHVHDGVWISDARRRTFTFLSETTARLWGVRREEILADPASLGRLIHPDDVPHLAEAVKGLDAGPVEARVRVIPPGKAIRWLRLRMFPMRDEQGQVSRVAGLTEDVTDHHAAAELLEQTQRHAIRLVQALREPMSVLAKALGGHAENDESAELAAAAVADSIDRERLREFQRRAAGLTVRERQVMDLIVAGHSTRQIAVDLGLSPKTVETHRAHLLRKTAVSSIAELVRLVVLQIRKPPSE